MKPIVIIGCGAKKQTVPSAARHLYIGPLFTATLAYAQRLAPDSSIRILSAKHGLVNLDATLAPYEATWKRGPCISTRELAAQLPISYGKSEFILLCGEDYRLALGYAFQYQFHAPMKMQAPLAHLGIGQQLNWLKENTPHHEDS